MSTVDQARLVRRYRRLLLSYPRWHRDVHGDDMLTTLLDDAADGRGGPRATLALVADGVRCRFGVRGLPAVLVSALCALAGAGLAAGVTGWAAWQVASEPWPTVAEARAWAAPVLPGGPPRSVTRADDAMGGSSHGVDRLLIPLLGDPEWHPGGVTVHHVVPSAEAGAGMAAAPARLRAAGWRVHSARGGHVAERGGMRLTIVAAGREPGTDDVVVTVHPAPPAAAYTAAVAGAMTGSVAAWLIAAAAVARQRRQSLARRVRARLLGVGGAVAVLPAVALNLLATVQADAGASAAPPWLGFGVVLARPAAAVGVVLIVAALLATRGPAARPCPSHAFANPY